MSPLLGPIKTEQPLKRGNRRVQPTAIGEPFTGAVAPSRLGPPRPDRPERREGSVSGKQPVTLDGIDAFPKNSRPALTLSSPRTAPVTDLRMPAWIKEKKQAD